MKAKITKKGIIPILILFIGFVLIFVKLGDRKLWVDECVSAYLSNNVIKYGYPSVYDGAYYKSVANGNDSNSQGVEAWYSWLTIYLQGLFRYLFGTSEFVTRLPTAILGWLSMLYLFLGVKKLTENEFIQNLTLAIYVFSIPMLIYIRSAHYYSAVLCFTTMSLFYYLSLIEKPDKKINTVMFALSLTLLFHSNYFLFIIPTTSYLVHAAIVARKKTIWVKMLIAYTATFLLTTPWFLYIGITTQGTKVGVLLGLTTLEDNIMRLFVYISKIHAYFTPFLILLVIWFGLKLFTRIYHFKVEKSVKSHVVLLSLLFIFTSIILSPIIEPLAQTRRLLAAVPMLFLISAILMYEIYQMSKVTGIILIPIFIFTNWLHVLPWKYIDWMDYPIHENIVFQSPITLQTLLPANSYSYAINESEFAIPIKDFYDELTIEFTCRTDAIIEYLKKNALPGETVICATIEAPKVYYYTGLKIVKQLDIDGSVWGPLGSFYFKEYPNVQRCLKYDYVPDNKIDWILSQDLVPFTFDDENYLNKNRHLFDEIRIHAPNTFIDNTAEMDCHYFKPKEFCEEIKIYHLKSENKL